MFQKDTKNKEALRGDKIAQLLYTNPVNGSDPVQHRTLFEINSDDGAMHALNMVVVTLNSFCKQKCITEGFAQYGNKIEGIERRKI